MLKTNKYNRLKKFVKRFFLVFAGVIVVLNLAIIFSGKTYLYKGIKETYLKGKSGPGIYDSLVFHTRTIARPKVDNEWTIRSTNNLMSDKHKKVFSQLKTTSFLIVQKGEIVFEKYWENHSPSMRSNSFSVSKSILGLLMGIALDKQLISSFDDPITKYLSFLPAKDSSVTIRHLLAMASGLQWRESGSNPLSENAAAYYGSDLKKLVHTLNFDQAPNEVFEYKSGNSQLLALILQKASGQNVSAFMEKELWGKIGASKNALWSLDRKNGMEKAFCCLYATTRDYARIGQLILNQGIWKGDTIIHPKTLKELTKPAFLQKKTKESEHYGLHFWIYNDPQYNVIYARGILGQYIITIPELDLVIVRTGHERKDVFQIPVEYEKDKRYIEKNKHKLNHPSDLFDYIAIAKEIIHL